uniref:tyrosine-type recombinase/integrase n=1 Tax=Umezakia ovalisporum TaxID=75695 RepID=UPI0039C63D3B
DSIRRIKLPEKALKLLALYPQRQLENFVFPLLKPMSEAEVQKNYKASTGGAIALINKDLKIIAKMLDFRFNLTTHIARHTFADHARQKIKDVFEIQKALGHAQLTVTEGYLQNLHDGDVNEALAFIDEF